MLRFGPVSLLALVCSAAAASAAGYDDFAQGLSANNNGNTNLAISSFTSALKASDLNASLVPVAYNGRAMAYLRGHECSLALADAAAALKLKPDYQDALWVHASAAHCLGDAPTAIADYGQLVALQPSENAYRSRGFLHWAAGDFALAAPDFAAAAKLSQKPAHEILWHEMSLLRAGTFDPKEEAQATEPLDLDDWPGPVFNLYAGKAKPDDVLHAAESGDAQTAVDQKCEANYYTGEWWLEQHNVDAARSLLEAARTGCPHNFVEYGEADVELKRLK